MLLANCLEDDFSASLLIKYKWIYAFYYLFILFFHLYTKLQVFKKKLYFQIKFTDLAFLIKNKFGPSIFKWNRSIRGQTIRFWAWASFLPLMVCSEYNKLGPSCMTWFPLLSWEKRGSIPPPRIIRWVLYPSSASCFKSSFVLLKTHHIYSKFLMYYNHRLGWFSV